MKNRIRIVPKKYGVEYPSLTSRFAWVCRIAQAASAREVRVARAQVERIRNRKGKCVAAMSIQLEKIDT